jgi:hypothetical protein
MVFVAIGGIVAGLIAIGTVTDSLTRRHRRAKAKGTDWADPHGQSRWQTAAAGDAAAAAQLAPPPMIGGGGSAV